jgi:hypothetical protein
MPYHLSVSAILLVAVVSACAEPAPAPRPKTVYYFPVTVGAKWVHIWKSESGKEKDREEVEIVTNVKDGKDGAKFVTVGYVADDGLSHPRQVFEVSDRGLIWIEKFGPQSGAPFKPLCELKLPHKPGQSWSDDDYGINAKLMAQGPEKIKVPAGEFDCIRVEYRDDRDPEPTQTRWYAPGVGMVKIKSDDLIIVLKSFKPGKE